MSDNVEGKSSNPPFLQRIVEGALGNALWAIVFALGVAVIALLTTVVRHVAGGDFFESLLWFCGAWGVCILFLFGLMMAVQKGFTKAKFTPPATPQTTLTAIEVARQSGIFQYGKTAVFLLAMSAILLVTVAMIKWQQYIYNHRMHADIPKSGLSQSVGPDGAPTPDCVIGIITHITNSGPDSKPFNWKLIITIPSAGHPFYGQIIPGAEWDNLKLSGQNSGQSPANDLSSAFSNDTMKSGTEKTGMLMFGIGGLPASQIVLGTKFELQFEDGQGHIVKAETAWNGPIGPHF